MNRPFSTREKVLLVVLVSWKARKRLRTGILYGVLFSLIGAVGYWDMMLVTLSIVIASVIIALIIGISSCSHRDTTVQPQATNTPQPQGGKQAPQPEEAAQPDKAAKAK